LLEHLRKAYRKTIPISFRASPLAIWLKGNMSKLLLGNDGIYDEGFYESLKIQRIRDVIAISRSIILDLQPATAVDIGCGAGELLEALRNAGVEVFGLENSKAGLSNCYRRKLNVVKFNLEKDKLAEITTFDIAVSMEVAEHLPKKVAERYVDLLTQLSSVIIFSAAPPGQGGSGHINEQSPSYWISKFARRGFVQMLELTQKWRDDWECGGVDIYYHRNLMIFHREKASDVIRNGTLCL